ncbi:MAG: GNAT family N-acetyltransferase [Taibaiella sp.]|nr:GNAT family N-acetyltransferase [Taibaiella sp.]
MEPQVIILETERLLLKGVTPEFYEYIMSHYSDAELMSFFGCATCNELEAEKLRHKKSMVCYYQTFRRFMLVDKTSGTTIGQCGYHKWYNDHYKAELGYALNNEAVKRQGYMREALQPIVAHGFNEMQLHRIEAFASPQNTPTIKLLTNLGFQYEGLMRGHYLKNGVYEDSACYALLREEYAP